MKVILNTRQAASRLGIHINTVYQYIHSGILKAHKIGGSTKRRHWRIYEEDLLAFVNGHSIGNGTDTWRQKPTISKVARQVASPPGQVGGLK